MMIAQKTINPLTSRVNISSSTSSSSLLSHISSSPPDLVLLCGDAAASPLLLHSAVAQTHFPAISNVLQVIIEIMVFLVLILSFAGAEVNVRTQPVLDGGCSAGDQPA